MNGLDFLKPHFNGHVAFRERRPGVVQVLAPLFHEDGDMLDIFVDLPDADAPSNGARRVRVSDYGMTLMRLSYSYDLDTPNKERVFHRMLAENRIQEQDGNLFLEADLTGLYPAILQFAQGVAKVSSMQYFKREVIASLFYEQLAEFIEERLGAYRPRSKVLPIAEHDEYEVDYELSAGPRPIYLFGVKDDNKARLAAISCKEFQLKSLPFRSVMVHPDFDALTKKDRARIMSAGDKLFPSLDDFRENGPAWFEREAA
jgi:Domain of unknown function DUF1828